MTDAEIEESKAYFTEEERRLYDEAHAPMRDRMRRAVSDAWLPLVCAIVIVISVAIMVMMRYSNAILVIFAVSLVILMMGAVIHVTYKEQAEANRLADKAERIYKATMAMKDDEDEKTGK